MGLDGRVLHGPHEGAEVRGLATLVRGRAIVLDEPVPLVERGAERADARSARGGGPLDLHDVPLGEAEPEPVVPRIRQLVLRGVGLLLPGPPEGLRVADERDAPAAHRVAGDVGQRGIELDVAPAVGHPDGEFADRLPRCRALDSVHHTLRSLPAFGMQVLRVFRSISCRSGTATDSPHCPCLTGKSANLLVIRTLSRCLYYTTKRSILSIVIKAFTLSTIIRSPDAFCANQFPVEMRVQR